MHVLVVDDNAGVRDALQLLFTLHDVEVQVAASPAQALHIVERGQTGVVVQDMNFSTSATTGEEGQALFRRLRSHDPNLPIILVTAWTSLETAVTLVREGADDYIGKPWDDQALVDKVRRLMAARELQSDKTDLAEADLAGLVYASAELHALVSLALRVAPADVPVLITGASGTGKERLAELIRVNSRRKDAPFITLNAGALAAEQLEAELFGAEAGAYTGSKELRRGRFEIAVSDRGQGLSEEAAERAVLPFWSTKPEGTGLGLALCRDIVGAHQGWFSLGNRTGGGAIARLWVPGGAGPDT